MAQFDDREKAHEAKFARDGELRFKAEARRNKLDKDRFRQDLGGVVEAYREVAQRLGILVENDNALTTGPRLVQ